MLEAMNGPSALGTAADGFQVNGTAMAPERLTAYVAETRARYFRLRVNVIAFSPSSLAPLLGVSQFGRLATR